MPVITTESGAFILTEDGFRLGTETPAFVLDDLYLRIKNAVATQIQLLDLRGGTVPGTTGTMDDIGDNVFVMPLPDASNINFPCVMVTSEGEREEPLGGSSEHRDAWWPVRVFIANRDSPRRHENEVFYSAWRKMIYDSFLYTNSQNLGGMKEVRGCVIVPEVIYDPKLPQYQYMVSGLVLRFYVQERRT